MPGSTDVSGIFGLSGNLFKRIPPKLRPMHDFELGRIFHLHRAGKVPFDAFPPGQLSVGDPVPGSGLFKYLTVFDGKLPDRNMEPLRGELQEHRSRLGGGGPKRRAEKACRSAAEGPHVPRAEIRISHDHIHAVERHVQFVCQHLGQRSDHALTHFDLSGKAGNPAVFPDFQKGVEIRGEGRPFGLLGKKRQLARR